MVMRTGKYFHLLFCWILLVIPTSPVLAQTDSTLSDGAKEVSLRGLGVIDWIVIILYGLSMLLIGWYYSRRQDNSEEYLLGSRSMKSFVVGISLYATLLSTISYLAQPGEIIKHGPVILMGSLSIPVIYLVAGYLLIPRFMKLKYTSGYEILQDKLGVSTRLTASIIFILTRLVWMALLIYLAGKAMVVMLGWPDKLIPYVVILSGLITVAYTTLGGFRAVVITDAVQFFILLAGPIITIAIISFEMGGIGAWLPRHWAPNWDSQPFFSFDPRVRVTVLGSMVSYAMWWICTAGSDQMAIQRYLATRDASAARRAFLVNNFADVLVTVLLSLTGFALLAFFLKNPQLANGGDPMAQADYLFPHYVANYAPVGIAGLVVAGMFAAAMSSLASGINSVITVFTTDFLDRTRKTALSEKQHVRRTKLLVLGLGVIIVFTSSLMEKVPGNIFEVTNKTSGLFVGPLFGLFFMALFVPFAKPFGTLCGAVCGFAAAVLVAYWDVITGNPALSFQWIIIGAVTVHIIVGSLLSLVPSILVQDKL
jgi:SSS family solute:Na+ symporter